MATLIHTIQMNGGEATRTSKSRRYVACLVATVTDRTVELSGQSLETLKRDVAVAETHLSDQCRQHTCTVQEAFTWYEAECERVKALSRELSWDEWKVHHNRMYDKSGKYGVVCAADEVGRLRSAIENYRRPVPGTQLALSWHMTVPNAQTARGGREAAALLERGYEVTVRTDISVREQMSRRTKKASQENA